MIGKAGSVFVSTSSLHAGQETTITSFYNTLIHQGMVIVGLPYGATTIAGGDGSRTPTEGELTMARFQGEHVAKIAGKLAA